MLILINQRILNKIKRKKLLFFFQMFKDIKKKSTNNTQHWQSCVGNEPLLYIASKTAFLESNLAKVFKCVFFFWHAFYFFLIYLLFIFGCVGSSLLRVGFLQLRQAGAALCCSARASHCGGFSCCRARALSARASVVVAHGLSSCVSWALECRLSSCGALAQLLRGMQDFPGPVLEPMSPALKGGLLTTVPPEKSLACLLIQQFHFQEFILNSFNVYV